MAQEHRKLTTKVSRPELTDAPEPPKEITPWLQRGWQSIDSKVIVELAIKTGMGEQVPSSTPNP